MVKFTLKDDKNGKPYVVGIGLSAENIRRLQAGQPILFNLKELGLIDLDILILTGETEDSIAETVDSIIKTINKGNVT
jgi:hypothetical protein